MKHTNETRDKLAQFAKLKLDHFREQNEDDVWYSLGESWDINLFCDDDEIHATAYPVEDGQTIGGEWVTLWTIS